MTHGTNRGRGRARCLVAVMLLTCAGLALTTAALAALSMWGTR